MKDANRIHNRLNINELPPPISEVSSFFPPLAPVTWRTWLVDFWRLLFPLPKTYDIRDRIAMRIADRYGLLSDYKQYRREGLDILSSLEHCNLLSPEIRELLRQY